MRYITTTESGLKLHVPGKCDVTLFLKACNIDTRNNVWHYTFEIPEIGNNSAFYPFAAFGIGKDDAIRLIFSNGIKPFSTYRRGIIGYKTMDDINKLLQVVDDEVARRNGIQVSDDAPENQETETAQETQDRQHRLAGHVQLEFE